jgi:hypothetical protein
MKAGGRSRRVGQQNRVCRDLLVEGAIWTNADRPTTFTFKSASLSLAGRLVNAHGERQGGRFPCAAIRPLPQDPGS